MGEAKRRKEMGFGLADGVEAFADRVLQGTEAAPHIMIGPTVWELDEHGRRYWYFVVCSGDDRGELRIDRFKVGMDDLALADECRARLMVTLLRRRPVAMHDFDDELKMAKFCEAIFPSDRSSYIRAGLERERRSVSGL